MYRYTMCKPATPPDTTAGTPASLSWRPLHGGRTDAVRSVASITVVSTETPTRLGNEELSPRGSHHSRWWSFRYVGSPGSGLQTRPQGNNVCVLEGPSSFRGQGGLTSTRPGLDRKGTACVYWKAPPLSEGKVARPPHVPRSPHSRLTLTNRHPFVRLRPPEGPG